MQNKLIQLANIATSQPHATFTAFIHGFVHKLTFLFRTNPFEDNLLQPLQDIIRSRLIPAWTGRAPPNDCERDLFSLPARLGGLGITDVTKDHAKELAASLAISAPLSNQIDIQAQEYSLEILNAQIHAKQDARKSRQEEQKSLTTSVRTSLGNPLKHALDLAQEKGASTWLTSLPLEEFGFALHKGAFRDALALRYGRQPTNTPTNCACGVHVTVEHSLSCPKGGFPSIRHNEVRDTVGGCLSEVCNDVCIEPLLQRLTGETLRGATANTEDAAKLDVAANGFLGRQIRENIYRRKSIQPSCPVQPPAEPLCHLQETREDQDPSI